MFKKLQLILLSILFFIFINITAKNISILFLNQPLLAQTKAFYYNVDQSFIDYSADVKKQLVFVNKNNVSGIGEVFRWDQYAGSWNEFKNNYKDLILLVYMTISFNSAEIKWEDSKLYIPLKNITNNPTNWVRIIEVDERENKIVSKKNTYARLEYNCWISKYSILIRFQLVTCGNNSNDKYYYSINTKRVSSNTTYDCNFIKSLLARDLEGQSLFLDSDYSTSLKDERNKIQEEIMIDNLVKKVLGKYYLLWKPYMSTCFYNDETNKAYVMFKFFHPTIKQEIGWIFGIEIKFSLTQNYWVQRFTNRLTIIPGKIINVRNPNGEMILDSPLEWNGKNVYATTAFIRFDGTFDGSETMKVNGVPIPVLDNQFSFQMTDNQEHKTNEYDILLEEHDLEDYSKIIRFYNIKYLIKQNTPNLELAWYAWNPSKNPDQKKIIEPFLENGETNINYDSEVNIKTGTKTQIIWIKYQALKPFPLDPIDKNGNIIFLKSDYDKGFLAEGSVSGMGIAQNFNDPWINSVVRLKVDAQTLEPEPYWEIVNSDENNSYFSLSGTYLYVLTDQKGFSINKFIIIGQKWQDKYVKFLDIINNSDIAVLFWDTNQGFHLKNYLINHKKLNLKIIKNLSFEQVNSYWKEYVSDINSQRIIPDFFPWKNLDLSTIHLNIIKMNSSDISSIKNNIIINITNELNKYQLEYNIDYQIKNLEENIKSLLNYDVNNNATISLTIKALDTSINARNSTVVIVNNNKDFDFWKAIDLSEIKFDDYQYNFSLFTKEQLKEWILELISNTFEFLHLNLVYKTDYNVIFLSDDILEQFINSKKLINLTTIINSELLSNLVVNSTTLTIINNLTCKTAPKIPPNPKIDSNLLSKKLKNNELVNKDNKWNSKKHNLIIISIVIAIVFISVLIIFFFKYRFKKGIGIRKKIKK